MSEKPLDPPTDEEIESLERAMDCDGQIIDLPTVRRLIAAYRAERSAPDLLLAECAMRMFVRGAGDTAAKDTPDWAAACWRSAQEFVKARAAIDDARGEK